MECPFEWNAERMTPCISLPDNYSHKDDWYIFFMQRLRGVIIIIIGKRKFSSGVVQVISMIINSFGQIVYESRLRLHTIYKYIYM